MSDWKRTIDPKVKKNYLGLTATWTRKPKNTSSGTATSGKPLSSYLKNSPSFFTEGVYFGQPWSNKKKKKTKWIHRD